LGKAERCVGTSWEAVALWRWRFSPTYLPSFDYLDPTLRGERFHEAMAGLRSHEEL